MDANNGRIIHLVGHFQKRIEFDSNPLNEFQ